MKTVRDACVLQPNALDINVADQIEQLDQLIADEKDGIAFFEKTFITDGMRILIDQGIARLAGKSSQAVFHLKQAMGGGKTHIMVGFGLLAKHPALRTRFCKDTLYISDFDEVKIAAFNGRNDPANYFWGELATQLGKEELFTDYWTYGAKAPDENAWLKLFEGDTPILILLDEMPPYFEYYDNFKTGNGTIADIVTRAFSNMLTAASKKKNVCVVVSDLTVTYTTGGKLINRALENARGELGRQETSITPVDLSANEIYDILRKRLFHSLPDKAVIDDIASAYGRKLEEAIRAKTVSRSSEEIADEIADTYPFHPRLKNVIALFKENETFRQTRGLIELISRLLRSVWERDANDVFLIGPQHFDLGINEVRHKLVEISGMNDVVATDLWDEKLSAHAQKIDQQTGSEAASQLGSLLLTASLSTAVNAVKGLTQEEIVESLINPLRDASEFLSAFEELEKTTWYLHHTPEGRYYFDRQENLTKLLESLAHDAPENQVDDLIRSKLSEMFRPIRKTCYEDVFPLPKLTDVYNHIRQKRILLIFSPDSRIPPEEVQKFFEGLPQKNNLCVLTGDKTAMGSVEKAARQLFASNKANNRIPLGHPQRDDLEKKQQEYQFGFTSVVLNLFDKVLFPIQRAGKQAELVSKPLDMSYDTHEEFNGEKQIEKSLTSNPVKLFLDIDKDFDAIRDKAQDLLWPEMQEDARWQDIIDRCEEQAGMYWLPPKGLDTLKITACNRGLWEDLGNGWITKKPRAKCTSVQVIAETEPDDRGEVRLRVNTQNAGPSPRIYYMENGSVDENCPRLTEQTLTTNAFRVSFLVVDPSGQYPTGDPVVWTNKLVIRNKLISENDLRTVELFVAPGGTIRYTLDGSEPREGTSYEKPIPIGDGEILLRVFAEAPGLEAKTDFRFTAKGRQGLQIKEGLPGALKFRVPYKLDARGKTFEGLHQAKERSVTFEGVVLNIGQGNKAITISIGEISIDADFIEKLLNTALEQFLPDAPVSMSFRYASFSSGHDLQEFARITGIQLRPEEVEQ